MRTEATERRDPERDAALRLLRAKLRRVDQEACRRVVLRPEDRAYPKLDLVDELGDAAAILVSLGVAR